jgi:uncharacterized protein (TIGR03382 family)
MKSFVLGVAALAACAGFAHASLIVETESNNSAATANNIGSFAVPGGSVLVDGTITGGGAGIAGDVDWFRFTVGGTSTVVTSVFSLDNTVADSELWLVGADGTTILGYNDDGNSGGGAGGMSSLLALNLAPGNYYLALSGWDDGGAANSLPDGFNGSNAPAPGAGVGHGENFTYKLLVGFNIVPSPGALALLGVGGVVMGRRRR